jgi:Uma2 family endonuclease
MQLAESLPPVVRSRKKVLTYDDYVRLTPPDSGNYELHNGKIIYIASPTPSHQRVAGRIFRRMADYVDNFQKGEVFIAPLDTKFDEINTFQPDVLFISTARKNIVSKKKIDGVPDLVVEILSEGNNLKEMSYKKYVYESYGVKEYWVVNLQKRTVSQLVNHDGEFVPAGIWKEGESFESVVLPGLRMEVAAMLEGIS